MSTGHTCTPAVEGEDGRGHTREEWRELDHSQGPEDQYGIHNMPQYLWPFGNPLIKTINKDSVLSELWRNGVNE
jgi:hypothetical protein